MRTVACLALASMTCLVAADDLGTGRYAEYTLAAAKGSHMKVSWAGHLGAAGFETAVGAAILPGDVLVVVGNQQGGPSVKPAIPLGAPGTAPALPADAKTAAAEPQQAGILTVGPLGDIATSAVWSFGYGVASITAVAVAGERIVVAGRCGPAFTTLKSACVAWQELPAGDKAKEGASASYLAALSAAGKLLWVVQAQATGGAPDEVFTDKSGNAYADLGALVRVDAAGKAVVVVAKSGRPGGDMPREGWRAVSPDGKTFFYGGDRNTRTNKEPYRQPFLYTYDDKGEKTAVWYEPDPKSVGSDAGHLESDSAINDLVVKDDGTWMLAGWSDGGNSVLTWQPGDFKKEVPITAMGWSPWGAGVLGSGHIWQIEPKSKTTSRHLWWLAFLPSNFIDPKSPKKKGGNRPNSAATDRIALLSDGSVAVQGSAATGLIQTPNSLYTYPNDGRKYGGGYVAVLSPDLERILFSSYLPGVKVGGMATADRRLVVVGTSSGNDGREKPVTTPVAGGGKPCAGGTDAWVAVLSGD